MINFFENSIIIILKNKKHINFTWQIIGSKNYSK
jgi:hypothetical protein